MNVINTITSLFLAETQRWTWLKNKKYIYGRRYADVKLANTIRLSGHSWMAVLALPNLLHRRGKKPAKFSLHLDKWRKDRIGGHAKTACFQCVKLCSAMFTCKALFVLLFFLFEEGVLAVVEGRGCLFVWLLLLLLLLMMMLMLKRRSYLGKTVTKPETN